MAQAVLWNKQTVEVTPDNWNDLAKRERELRAEAFGRPLTSAESVAIIQAFRQKGLAQGPVDYKAGIDQAAESVSYTREAQKLIQNPSRIPGAVKDLLSIDLPDLPSLPPIGPTMSLLAIAGIGLLIWGLTRRK
jgi:hypothetical protein